MRNKRTSAVTDKVNSEYFSTLVIIPAGKEPEYAKWSELHTDYNFDMCILDYEFHSRKLTDHNSLAAKYVYAARGLKFKLIKRFFEDNPKVSYEYDYVMIMDDDIITTPKELRKFFHIMRTEKFDLAQPALGKGSSYFYPSTLRVEDARYHYTNSVEIMMPCFSRNTWEPTLKELLDMPGSGYGFGLEGFWEKQFHKVAGESIFGGKIGIIDDVNFYHLRPLGDGGIYKKFGSPWIEQQYLSNKYKFKWKGKSSMKTFEVVR